MNMGIGSHTDFPKLRGSMETVKLPAFVEAKYDGEYNILSRFTADDVFLKNKSGKIRFNCPITHEIERMVKKTATFSGELYYGDGTAGALYGDGFLKHQTDDELKFAINDILMYDEEDLRDMPLIERKEILTDLNIRAYKDTPHIHTVQAWWCNTQGEVDQRCKWLMAMGWEGAVIKPHDGRWMTGSCPWVKVKHKDKNTYRVSYIDPILERIEVVVDSNGKEQKRRS